MLYIKEGLPEEDDFVLCTVNKVLPHSVFCNLDEYDKLGVIHISEVSPGRIRNIRDFVREDKKIICKVLRVNKERGHIDLSLRRVNDSQKRIKNNQIKQELLAEKILEFVAKKLNKDFKGLYKEIMNITSKDYSSLYECFENVVESDFSLESLGIEKKLSDELKTVIIQRIKPLEVSIKGTFDIEIYTPDGIEVIKEAMKKAQSTDEKITIRYKSAGHYNVSVKAPDYPEAENILKKAVDTATDIVESKHGKIAFSREK